jgi:hypothetical protein
MIEVGFKVEKLAGPGKREQKIVEFVVIINFL